MNDLFEITSSSKVPLAVVDQNGKLQGVIVRGALLGALGGEVSLKEVSEHAENTTR
ncbi:Glycine betaine transport ATP-binding protein OpuAA [compost metagenome]